MIIMFKNSIIVIMRPSTSVHSVEEHERFVQSVLRQEVPARLLKKILFVIVSSFLYVLLSRLKNTIMILILRPLTS